MLKTSSREDRPEHGGGREGSRTCRKGKRWKRIVHGKVCACPTVHRCLLCVGGSSVSRQVGNLGQRSLCKTRVFGCLLTFFHPDTPLLVPAVLQVDQEFPVYRNRTLFI